MWVRHQVVSQSDAPVALIGFGSAELVSMLDNLSLVTAMSLARAKFRFLLQSYVGISTWTR